MNEIYESNFPYGRLAKVKHCPVGEVRRTHSSNRRSELR
jgi:hypothetical protein